MDLGLKGKRALVIGSTSGLGEGILRRLAAEGALVAATGRSTRKALRITAELEGSRPYKLDLRDEKSVEDAIEALQNDFGGLDIIVCNSGGPPSGAIISIDPEVWYSQFEIMFVNQLRIVNNFLPSMRNQGWGRILIVTSSGVKQPIPNLGISNSIRGAQLGWGKTLANEVAQDGVTVNFCAPGRIQTARVDELDLENAKKQNKTVEEIRTASRAGIPVGRYGTVNEFADAAVFLLSSNASYITGSVMQVDGGLIRGF